MIKNIKWIIVVIFCVWLYTTVSHFFHYGLRPILRAGAPTHSTTKLHSFYNSETYDECALAEMQSSIGAHARTPDACLRILTTMFEYTTTLLTTNNITHWAMKGTLLGAFRDGGMINHDYDVDLAMLHTRINDVQRLRRRFWNNGYILFEAPWSLYRNLQFVLTPQTLNITRHLTRLYNDSLSPTSTREDLWRQLVAVSFTCDETLLEMVTPLEIIAYTKVDDYMIQVLCTRHQGGTTMNVVSGIRPFDLTLDPNITFHWREGRRAYHEFEAYQRSLPQGWRADMFAMNGPLIYVNKQHRVYTTRAPVRGLRKPPRSPFNTDDIGWQAWAQFTDYEYIMYTRMFSQENHTSSHCRHTAPYSFRYFFANRVLWPLHYAQFHTFRVPVPMDSDSWLSEYFGPSYMNSIAREYNNNHQLLKNTLRYVD